MAAQREAEAYPGERHYRGKLKRRRVKPRAAAGL
jgi:hypothetical protein